MIRYDEPAETYHAIPAFSAGLAWDIVGPDGCLALAYARSRWLNPDYVPEEPNQTLDSGVIAHLAVLEDKVLQDRIVVVDANSWRTKQAQVLRDMAYAGGKIPILAAREPGSPGASLEKVMEMRHALQANRVADELLFGEGKNEVSYDWTDQATEALCKARADRVIRDGMVLVDLKTAQSVSPEGFQRNMVRYGHHLRAAFYLDGWGKQTDPPGFSNYIFVCVRSEPPHLVATYQLSAETIEWGRKLYRRALIEFSSALNEEQPWHGYTGDTIMTIGLPTWAEYRLADSEAQGDL